jgi:glycosyltransferase involved in cell wall biosynthesis
VSRVSLLIEGWRGINHSYALVNQFQLLALLRRKDVCVFHRDLPYYASQWNRATNDSGLRPEDQAAIDALPAPQGSCDVTYRISYPFRLYGGDSDRIFTFGTCEFQRIDDGAIYAGVECSRKYRNQQVTVITPSNWSRVGFLRGGFPAEAVKVVPHGVDPATFHPLSADERSAVRRALGIPDTAFVFLNAGAMSGNKGVDLLLAAFAHIRKRRPDAMLLLKDQRNLYNLTAEALIADLRRDRPGLISDEVLSSIATMGANLPLAEMRLLYGACDAYVSPYRAEGFNLTPLEAAACGTPIVVTEGGSTDDYAQPTFALKIASKPREVDGRSVIDPELESLVTCMEMLIERRAPHIDMAAGAAWVLAHFSWDRAAEKLVALFAG